MAIRELTQQNERLTEDLRIAALREENLETENQTLREKMTARSSSMHARVGQLEILQQEVNLKFGAYPLVYHRKSSILDS